MAINKSKLEKQLDKALKTGKGFTHTDLNGKTHRVTDKDVEIFSNKHKLKLDKVSAKQLEKKGGFLPLIPLFAGLSALGALSGGAAGIAKAVSDSKHNTEMEKIAREKGVTVVNEVPRASPVVTGKGLYLNPQQGAGIKDFIKNIVKQSNVEEVGKKALKEVLSNLAKNGAEVSVSGSGLFLQPYIEK